MKTEFLSRGGVHPPQKCRHYPLQRQEHYGVDICDEKDILASLSHTPALVKLSGWSGRQNNESEGALFA